MILALNRISEKYCLHQLFLFITCYINRVKNTLTIQNFTYHMSTVTCHMKCVKYNIHDTNHISEVSYNKSYVSNIHVTFHITKVTGLGILPPLADLTPFPKCATIQTPKCTLQLHLKQKFNFKLFCIQHFGDDY